jgi:hypothetical protein
MKEKWGSNSMVKWLNIDQEVACNIITRLKDVGKYVFKMRYKLEKGGKVKLSEVMGAQKYKTRRGFEIRDKCCSNSGGDSN